MKRDDLKLECTRTIKKSDQFDLECNRAHRPVLPDMSKHSFFQVLCRVLLLWNVLGVSNFRVGRKDPRRKLLQNAVNLLRFPGQPKLFQSHPESLRVRVCVVLA